jgi:hypothetical protein
VNADVETLVKFAMLLVAVYGTYKSARTALRLAGELFG